MAIFQRRKEPTKPSVLPDPATKFPHRANTELFCLFKKRWLERTSSRIEERISDYPFGTLPDLIERFRSLAPVAEVIQGSAYGHAIMANADGIVFAWAGGMNDIFLRLPRSLQQHAIDEAGRFDPTYGQDWINFLAFGSRDGTRVDPEDALRRWMLVAYRESLKLTELRT